MTPGYSSPWPPTLLSSGGPDRLIKASAVGAARYEDAEVEAIAAVLVEPAAASDEIAASPTLVHRSTASSNGRDHSHRSHLRLHKAVAAVHEVVERQWYPACTAHNWNWYVAAVTACLRTLRHGTEIEYRSRI